VLLTGYPIVGQGRRRWRLRRRRKQIPKRQTLFDGSPRFSIAMGPFAAKSPGRQYY
jgi:hypothetical protein